MAASLRLRDVLGNVDDFSELDWLYLPGDRDWKTWDLDCEAAVLRNEEVPPEHEDDSDAGVPQSAKERNLRQALPIATVQEIVANVVAQGAKPELDTLLAAFRYYFEYDAFIKL
jgi:hypothetical protein